MIIMIMTCPCSLITNECPFLLEEREEAEEPREVMQEEALLMLENPDQETVIESLKSICNVMLHNETGLVGLLSLSLSLSLMHDDMNAAD